MTAITSFPAYIYSSLATYHPKKGNALLSRLTALAFETALKVSKFFIRHKKELCLYGAVAATLLFCNVSFPKVAVALLPGLAYMLCFNPGEELASDLLIEYDKDSPHNVWLPQNNQDANISKALMERYKTLNIVKAHLAKPSPDGWCIVHGETGAGKTSSLEGIAVQLAANGHRVFFLNTIALKSGALKGLLDTRFMVLVTYLAAVSLFSKKPPILIIDEFQKMVDPTSPGINDSLKMGVLFPFKFNILAATTTHDLKGIEQKDAAILRRFLGRKFLLANHDLQGAIETLDRVKTKVFHPSVTRTHIEYTLNRIKKIEANLLIAQAFDLLKGQEEVSVKVIEDRILMLDKDTQDTINGVSAAPAA